METARGPYTMVAYDASGKGKTPVAIGGTGGVEEAWRAAVAAVAPDDASFVLYDPKGTLVHIGMVPGEPLTDDPDVTCMAMDLAASVALTGHADGDLRLWDLATGDPLWTRAPADEHVDGVALVEPAGWALAWCDDGPLLVFDRASGELIVRVEDPQFGAFAVSVAPDASELLCTGQKVTRIALPSGEPLPALDVALAPVAGADAQASDDGGVEWAEYLGDGATVIGVRDIDDVADVVFWDRASAARTQALRLTHGVAGCDLSPDRTRAAFASGDGPTRVSIVDTQLHSVVAVVETVGRGVLDLRFTPDGSTLVLHAEGAGVVIIEPATGAVRQTIPEADGAMKVVPLRESVMPEESESLAMMVTHSRAGRLELTQLVARTPLGPVGRAASGDGARYATVPHATDNNYAAVYDLQRGVNAAMLAHRGNVQEIWMSREGVRFAVRAAGHVSVWHVPRAPEKWQG